jgi:4-hydroxy-tetrahydrodipicolinate synthase
VPEFAKPQVITALPTTFNDDESLNLAAFKELLQRTREGGVDAIFPAGTTGEFPVLSDDERLAILDASLEVFPADNVYFHVGAPSARQAVALTTRAAKQGATRLAAVTPYYQPAPEEAVLDYYSRLVEAAGTAHVYAYLFHARTSTVSEPSILPKLAAIGVHGVKLSGETDESVQAYLDAAPEGFVVFSGNDVSFEWLIKAGGHGIISGVSSVFPKPFVSLRDALHSGDASAAQEAQEQVVEAVAAVKAGSLTHLKAGLEARNIGAGPVRTAVAAVSETDAARISALVSRYGV